MTELSKVHKFCKRVTFNFYMEAWKGRPLYGRTKRDA